VTADRSLRAEIHGGHARRDDHRYDLGKSAGTERETIMAFIGASVRGMVHKSGARERPLIVKTRERGRSK
jgi:hypothetical protein